MDSREYAADPLTKEELVQWKNSEATRKVFHLMELEAETESIADVIDWQSVDRTAMRSAYREGFRKGVTFLFEVIRRNT